VDQELVHSAWVMASVQREVGHLMVNTGFE
jgi:hypothetical protein